jgi:folate-dependent phosphoribosylglycinamide formyltransferase PurN
VRVEPGDDVRSLTERVQRAEREFLIYVLQRIASGAIKLKL